MRLKFRLGVCLLGAFLMAAPAAQAGLPKNALGAVAVSPDGATVLAAGDNRVLYILDASDLTIRKKIWIGINPLSIHYSSDGQTAVIHDTRNNLAFYSTESWKKIAEKADAVHIAVAEEADKIIATGRARGRADEAKAPLYGYDLKTGNQVLSATIKMRLTGLGVTSDASEIYALSWSRKSDTEKKERIPSNLKGIDREIFRQKHDGRVADFAVIDGEGNEKSRFETWYSVRSNVPLISLGNSVMGLARLNVNGDFDAAAKSVKLFRTPNRTNHSVGYSMLANRMAAGGYIRGAIMNLETRTMTGFKIERIGGYQEFFRGMAIARDGTVYGGTSAYRIIKIDPNGKVVAAKPIY